LWGIWYHHGESSNYYPQGNGLVESTNKTLIQILKKTIVVNQRNWHTKLIDALWASRLTPKDNTGSSPYTLVYGKEAKIPIHLELNALTYIVNIEDLEEVSPLQRRYDQLMQLEEQRNEALRKMTQRQQLLRNILIKAHQKIFSKGTTGIIVEQSQGKIISPYKV
jgi:hypothetical protein